LEELVSRLVPSINTVNTAMGNPEMFGIGLDGQVYAEILSSNGFGSTGYFLTAPGRLRYGPVKSMLSGFRQTRLFLADFS
jgi:hypothetical protein